MPTRFELDYVEYGKVFDDFSASDFSFLDWSSDEMLEVAGARCQRFRDFGLKFPTSSKGVPFTKTKSGISVAFTRPSKKYCLFIQIQRRHEGDWAKKQGNKPNLNRPFNQTRFTYVGGKSVGENSLTLDNLYGLLQNNVPVFSNLLFFNEKPISETLGEHPNALDDYLLGQDIGGKKRVCFGNNNVNQSPEKTRYIKKIVGAIGKAIEQGEIAKQVQITGLDLSVQDKIEILDGVQLLLGRVLGLLTFCLDYISDLSGIKLHFYNEPISPNRIVVNLAEETRESKAQEDQFYKAIISLTEKYWDAWQTEGFSEKFRSYLRNGVSITDAAQIATVVCMHHSIDNGWDLFTLHKDILIRDGDILLFLKHVGFSSHEILQVLLKEKIELDYGVLKQILLDVSSGLSQNSAEELLRKYGDIISQDVKLLGSYAAKISFSVINELAINKTIVRKIFFIKLQQTKLRSVNTKEFVILYISLGYTPEDDVITFLYEMYESRQSEFYELSDDQKAIVYDHITDYVIASGDWISKKPFKGWRKGKEPVLDGVFLKKIPQHRGMFGQIIASVIEADDEESFKFLLGSFELSPSYIKSLGSEILSQSKKYPREALDKMLEICEAEMPRGESLLSSLQQNSFAYNQFPVSQNIQKWFWGYCTENTEKDILAVYQSLRSHPKLRQGLRKNPELNPFFSKSLSTKDVYKDAPVNSAKGKLLATILFSSDVTDREVNSWMTSLVYDLPNALANQWLAKIVHQKREHRLSSSTTAYWLEKTRQKQLRSEYKNTLHGYLSSQSFVNDDLLWVIYVDDYSEFILSPFNWIEFVNYLPLPRSDNSDYGFFVSLVKQLRPISLVVQVQVYQYRIQACAKIAKAEASFDKDAKEGAFKRIFNNVNYQDQPLREYLEKILRKKEITRPIKPKNNVPSFSNVEESRGRNLPSWGNRENTRPKRKQQTHMPERKDIRTENHQSWFERNNVVFWAYLVFLGLLTIVILYGGWYSLTHEMSLMLLVPLAFAGFLWLVAFFRTIKEWLSL
jgi:hypothetical protein